MKTNLFLRRVLWLMIPLLTMFTTNVWGAENTITLTYNSFGLTTTYAKKTATVSSIGFTVDKGFKGNGNVIQMNNSQGSGILYNTTAIKGLKSIAVTVSSGSKKYTITTGTSEKPTANSQTGTTTKTFNAKSGDTYFQLKVSGASYFSKIVITYEDATKTYHEWDGSSAFTTSTGGPTLKAVPSLCEWAIEPFGWCSEENYASGTYPTDKIWFEGDEWPAGKTDLYALYRVGSDPYYYYSTKPTIYTITYNLTNVTKDDAYSYSCMSDMADEVGMSNFYGYFKPDAGYTLDASCISITMGGSPVNSSNYSWNTEYSYPGHDYTAELYMTKITGNVVVTVTGKSCTQLADATNLVVQNPSTLDATKVKFTWTLGAGTSTNAAKQVFTLTKVGGASQSKDLTKTKTSGTVALSGLSDGTYNWSIQAIGDGVSYCDGNVVEGPSFTICTKDVSAVTPTVNATTSITKTGATANWTAVSDADHYTVKVYAGATATGSAVKTYTNVIGTSQAITGLTAGTQYCVTVQAHDACSHDSQIGTGGVFTTDAKVMRNIIWKNNGVELTAAERGSANTSMEVGEKLTAIPTLASGAVGKSCDTEGHPTFVGWTATPWNGEEPTAAGLFTADNLPTMPAGEGPITYHAVWADGSGVFELVTSAPSNWSGTYLIVSGAQAMSSDFHSGTSGEFKASEVTISNNKIECTDDKLIWIVAKNGDKAQYSFKNKSTGTYAKITGTKSTNAALDENAVWFTIENASGNVYDIVSVIKSARCFAYYPANKSFRTNAKKNYNTGSLYKASEATSYITSCSCPAYSFHFGTRSQSDWSDKVSYCFQESGDADGNSGVYWYLEDFVLPDKPHYYVGWQGSWNTTEAKSADADFSGLCFGLLRENSCGTNTLGTYSSGNNQGAVGTLRVRSNYADNNKYIDFIPGGYVLRLSDDNGSSYTSTEFVAASANLTETVWMTDLTTISAALASSGKYFVDLKTSSDHVWAPNISQVIATSNMGYKKVDGSWGTGLSSGMRGKFRIWADNCSKNWNCHFVPYYHLSYDGNGAGATNLPEASDDKSCEGDVAARTVVVSSTVPTRDGYTFVGWNTAANGSGTAKEAGDNVVLTSDVVLYAQWRQNFTVTYDRVGGTDVCANETCGAGLTYTVCTTEPTKSGYIFSGWLSNEVTPQTYAAGATFTMPAANVTLTAQWTANWHNLTFNVPAGGGTATNVPSGSHVLDNHTFTFPTITGIASEKWCWTFLGWTETAPNGSGRWDVTPSYIAGGATSSAITSDKTYYAVYSKTGAGASGDVYLTNAIITAKWADGGNTYGNSTTITAGGEWTYTGFGQKNNTYLQLKDGEAYYLQTPVVGGSITSVTVNYTAVSSDSRTVYFNTSASKTSAVTYTFDGTYISGNHDLVVDVSSLDATSIYILANNTFKFNSVSFHYGPAAIYGYTLDDCPCVVEEFDLTYDANATNFPGSTTTCTGVTDYRWDEHDNEYTICSTVPTLEGYKFTHWATNANGSGTTYNAGEVISCVGETPITLYAQYERVYTVTFNDQGVSTPITQASDGASVAVPSATSPCSGEWAFVGWSETAIAPMSFLPTLEIAAGEGTYTPTADKTLYAIYRKTSESLPFVAGMSGAYKISNGGDVYAGAYNSSKLPEADAVGAEVFYIKYTATDGGKYTIQRSDGKYITYSGSSTSLGISDDVYYWTMTKNGDLWHVLGVGSGRYLQYSSGTGFKAYNTNGPTDIAFVAAEGEYYYRTMSCADEFDITFHNNGTTINWAGGYPEAAYKGLADATVISTFPTATFDGWTFIGWRQADYKESTDAPASSSVFGGSNGTSGNKLTIASANVDLYPVFTRFEDNEPFDQINGGDYYIYFLESGSDDGYGAEKRVYAATHDGIRYNSNAVCDNATTFTFTKLDNGNWTIYDNTTKKYL